ncbi:hypothetical protein [Xenorhabdus sp. SGI246]|uniref:hypothetical protein n=1 Tax=Xenorhabdus sp. SGI246 TaxID=3158263 RepID=UPI00349FB897
MGATLIKVNVHLEEVREVKFKYDKEEVKNPDDAKKKGTGDQTQKVESQVSSSINEAAGKKKTTLKKTGDFIEKIGGGGFF